MGIAHNRQVLVDTAKLLSERLEWIKNERAFLCGVEVNVDDAGVSICYENYWMGAYRNIHFFAHKLTRRTERNRNARLAAVPIPMTEPWGC